MSAILCRSCGRRDGTHETNCQAVRRAEEQKLQAECDHDPSYGVTRTTGDELGPPLCGKCRINLRSIGVIVGEIAGDA